MFKFVILAALVATALGANIEPVACPGWPEAVSFGIRECTSLPCEVRVGQLITLDIGIELTSATTALPTTVMISAGGQEFPFPLPGGDACAAISGGCPKAPGLYIVSFPVTVSGVTAGQETTVRVTIVNQDTTPVACGSVTTTFT